MWSLGIQSISTPEIERRSKHPASQLRSLMKLLVTLQKEPSAAQAGVCFT